MWARYPEYNRTYATGTGGRHPCDLLVPASAAAVDTVMWNLLADADPVPERKAAAMAFAMQQLWVTDTDRIGNASGAGRGAQLHGVRFTTWGNGVQVHGGPLHATRPLSPCGDCPTERVP